VHTFIAQLFLRGVSCVPHTQVIQLLSHVQELNLAVASHVTFQKVRLILLIIFLIGYAISGQGYVHELRFSVLVQSIFLCLPLKPTNS